MRWVIRSSAFTTCLITAGLAGVALRPEPPLIEIVNIEMSAGGLVEFERYVPFDVAGTWTVTYFRESQRHDPICQGSGFSRYEVEEAQTKGPWSHEAWSGDPDCSRKIANSGPGEYGVTIEWHLRRIDGSGMLTGETYDASWVTSFEVAGQE